MPRCVHVAQIGGSNVFERLTPTLEQLASAESAREGKREARKLDGATFKPQRLAAASDVSRHMQSDPPPGSAVAAARRSRTSAGSFERLYSHETQASRAAKVTLTQSQAADGTQRMAPVTAMTQRDAECTFAPKLATDYTLPSQVRAAQSCSGRRLVSWLVAPTLLLRAAARATSRARQVYTSSNSAART